MQRISENDFSNAAFPYLTARPVIIGEIPVLAVRVTYVGELGWELYCPMESGLKLWNTLWEAGVPLGIVAAGYKAIDSLRLEKGYRYWSAEIHSEDNPYEAGLGFAVKLNKGDFIGRSALERIKAEGNKRKLCCLTLDDPGAVALGGEPLLDGERVLGTSDQWRLRLHRAQEYCLWLSPARVRRTGEARGRWSCSPNELARLSTANRSSIQLTRTQIIEEYGALIGHRAKVSLGAGTPSSGFRWLCERLAPPSRKPRGGGVGSRGSVGRGPVVRGPGGGAAASGRAPRRGLPASPLLAVS